jgi:hypothetical protein
MQTQTLTTRDKLIRDLLPRQSLAIAQYMTTRLADKRVDENEYDVEDQEAILNAAYARAGFDTVRLSNSSITEEAAGGAAQEFLRMLPEIADAEILRRLDELLSRPPEPAIQALPLVMALPVLLTACIVTLQTGVEVTKDEAGRWTFRIRKQPAEGKTLTDLASKLFAITAKLLPG